MKKIILAALAVLMMLCFVGCGEHIVSSTKITFKDGSVLELVGVGSVGMVIDGSPFSWTGGSAATVEGSGYSYTVTENGDNGQSWVSTETPFNGAYPEGFDASAKLKIGSEEGWVPYKVGGSVSFVWNNRK